MKKSSPYQETIEHQFDTLIRKMLKGEVKNYNKRKAAQREKEISLSVLNGQIGDQLIVYDRYISHTTVFHVKDEDLYFEGQRIGDALCALPQSDCKIVLMYYCMDMSDQEIAEEMHIARSTAFRRRKRAMEQLTRYLEDV